MSLDAAASEWLKMKGQGEGREDGRGLGKNAKEARPLKMCAVVGINNIWMS